MKKVIGFICLLVILFGGYLFPSTSAEAGGDKSKEDASVYDFVEMDPLILPIIDNNGISQSVSMVVTLEVSGSDRDKVFTYRPKLADAFLADLYGSLARHSALNNGVVNINVIKKRLQRISAKVLGPNIVDEVLVQVVQQRRV